MMHPIFHVGTIVHNILEHIEGAQLRECATVSRLWHDAAMDFVWKHAQLGHLWRLFPEDLLGGYRKDYTQKAFKRAITEEDWERFAFHARRIRHFNYRTKQSYESHLLLSLVLHRPEWIFPALQSIVAELKSSEDVLAITALVTPQLNGFSCSVDLEDVSTSVFPTALWQLFGALKRLRSLHYLCIQLVGDKREEGELLDEQCLVDSILIDFVKDNAVINTAVLTNLPGSNGLLSALGTASSLDKLRWTVSAIPETFRLITHKDAGNFASLTSFQLDLSDIKSSTTGFLTMFLLSCARAPVIEVELNCRCNPLDLGVITQTLAKQWPELVKMELAVLKYEGSNNEEEEDEETELHWAAFRPLLACRRMKQFKFWAHDEYLPVFTDKDVSEMRAWSDLRALTIDADVYVSPFRKDNPKVTSIGFIALALACPRLDRVTMELDLNVPVAPFLLKRLPVSSCALRRLHVIKSRVDQPHVVADFLRAAFPHLESVEYAPLARVDAMPALSNSVRECYMMFMEKEFARVRAIDAVNDLLCWRDV